MRAHDRENLPFEVEQALATRLFQNDLKPIGPERLAVGARRIDEAVGVQEQSVARIEAKLLLAVCSIREHTQW